MDGDHIHTNGVLPTEWQRLEAEYPNATPGRREHIDEMLDEMEWEAWPEWLRDHGLGQV